MSISSYFGGGGGEAFLVKFLPHFFAVFLLERRVSRFFRCGGGRSQKAPNEEAPFLCSLLPDWCVVTSYPSSFLYPSYLLLFSLQLLVSSSDSFFLWLLFLFLYVCSVFVSKQVPGLRWSRNASRHARPRPPLVCFFPPSLLPPSRSFSLPALRWSVKKPSTKRIGRHLKKHNRSYRQLAKRRKQPNRLLAVSSSFSRGTSRIDRFLCFSSSSSSSSKFYFESFSLSYASPPEASFPIHPLTYLLCR